MKLAEFLQEYSWNSAAQVRELRWTTETGLVLTMEAYPFWLPENERDDKKGTLTVTLNQIVATHIDLDWDPSAIEEFSTSFDDPVLLEYGQFKSIFGSGPLPDPRQFLLEYVICCERLGIAGEFLNYLNAESGLEKWFEIIKGHSYLLIDGPAKLVEECESILQNQNAKFTVIEGAERQLPELVRLDSSWIVCGESLIDFSVE